MKKIYLFLSVVVISITLYGQVPNQFSYQAIVRGSNDELIINKPITMKISLFQSSLSGPLVYQELHSINSNSKGLISIAIGNGNIISGDFASIDWSQGPYFVNSEIDPTGGVNYSLTSNNQLLSVPYALYAANSHSGPKGDQGDQGDQGPKGESKVNVTVSLTGDSLKFEDGSFVIINGISVLNNPVTKVIFDIDGNSYNTKLFGNQYWMVENLKVSKYNDGTSIPNVPDINQWSSLISGAWSYYNNDAANNAKYGKLYNWYALNNTSNGNKNVCPSGWHVPSAIEWATLTSYLGYDGGKMKQVSNEWFNPNTNASNTSLFSALPGGTRYTTMMNNGFNGQGYFSFWWSSTNLICCYLKYNNGYVIIDNNNNNTSPKDGYSVRCVKD